MAIFLATFAAVQAADFHVSQATGNDGNSGGVGDPWLTLAKATSTVSPGDTVTVYGGTYQERLIPPSGTPTAYVTFRAAPGETVVIDGSLETPAGRSGLIELSDRSYVRVEGFIVQNYSSATLDVAPVGIHISGTSDGVEIVGNLVQGIASTATPVLDDGTLVGRDAHGIGIYGTTDAGVTNLLIRANELTNLTLGSSEAMVVNGNVSGFRIFGNEIHDCDNIGIDAIGFEDNPLVTLEADNQARDGIIAGNHVYNINVVGNPSYAGAQAVPQAAGIYVDGGRDIILERNHVHHCEIGIEVAAEKMDKTTSGISVRSNLLRENLLAGLYIGGFDGTEAGLATSCTVVQNTFFNNDTDPSGDPGGQIYIQFRVSNCHFTNNILHHTIDKNFGDPAAYQYNAFIVQDSATGSGNVFAHNVHYGSPAAGGPGLADPVPYWVILGVPHESFASYIGDANVGTGGVFGNPSFVDTATLDFTPTALAIDSGNLGLVDPGARDFAGNQRISGLPDRGAIEVGAPPAPLPGLTPSIVGGNLHLDWVGEAGLFYEFQQSVDLLNWFTLPGLDSVNSDQVLPDFLIAEDRWFVRSVTR